MQLGDLRYEWRRRSMSIDPPLPYPGSPTMRPRAPRRS